MTLETAPESERRFLRAGVPWLIAAAAFVLYLATLSYGVTLTSLAVTARVSGWEWRPILAQPLLFLLTWPCRWLPAAMMPLVLNLLTAVCAALTLALLARSVALLPHDRLEQQRLLAQNERALLSLPDAWVPIVLAAVALGLQLSFWEHATAASGEMLDLLLFAFVIRCLLEYRLVRRQSWLDRAALVCGVGMANSWAMVAFLPFFLVAFLWTRRLSFFELRFFRRLERSGWQSARTALTADLRFVLRVMWWGLAGLSLFLVLPLAQTFSPDFSVGFWQALHEAAASYRSILLFLARAFFRSHRDVAFLLAAVSLLPVLVLSIRWRAFTSSNSAGRFDPVSLVVYLSHACLLLISIWVAFDPTFGPRQIGRRLGFSLPFLPLYYLGALSVGYYSGFFLLMAHGLAGRRRILRRAPGLALRAFIYTLVVLTPLGLLLKNLPALRSINRPYLDQYARWVARSLPPEGGVVLSDDPMRLAALRAVLARETNAGRYLLVELPALPLRGYLAYLARKHAAQWPELEVGLPPSDAARSASPAGALRNPFACLQLMTGIAEKHRVFYLQPGVGLLLERFYLQPYGLIYELKRYPTNAVSGPPLTAAELAGNAAFWQRALHTTLNPLLRLLPQPDRAQPGIESRLMELGHLELPPPAPAQTLALWHSAALNFWGATLQRNGHWADATPCFSLAQRLNPNNLPARVNLQCNSNLLAGWKMTVAYPRSSPDRFGQYRNWSQILADNGPFDEPGYCYDLARALAEAGLYRQACQQLERVTSLAPADLYPRMALGQLLNRCLLPDQALKVAAGIEGDPDLQRQAPGVEAELAFLQAEAWFAKTNSARAEAMIRSLLASHSEDLTLLNRAAKLYESYQSYSNALRVTDQWLRLAPGDPLALIRKGNLCIMLGDPTNAIPLLTRALSLTNAYPARLDRAFAYFHTGRLDEAEADYRALLQSFPADHQAWKGLAEIACRRGDTNAAVGYYQRCLSQVSPGSEEASVVAARLRKLQQVVR